MRRLLILWALVMLTAGCGKKGRLIYPEMLLPAAPGSFTVSEFGHSMRLSADIPKRDQAGRQLHDLSGLRILRRMAIAGQGADCKACINEYHLIRTLYLDVPGDAQIYGDLLLLLDGDVRSGLEYTYRLVPFTVDGQEGASTAPVSVVMLPLPSEPSVTLVPGPTELKLHLHKPRLNVDPFVGFNIYRTTKDEPFPYLPLNSTPLAVDTYVDTGLDRGVTYRYVARLVSRAVSGQLVESGPSVEVQGSLSEE